MHTLERWMLLLPSRNKKIPRDQPSDSNPSNVGKIFTYIKNRLTLNYRQPKTNYLVESRVFGEGLAMIIKEYRIPLPVTVEQYQIGQLYTVAEASKNETGGGEGVEVIQNEPFSNLPLVGDKLWSGQYTYKVYHLKRKVPTIVKLMAPKGALELHEKAWNAYPFCRTIVTNPTYMKENFTCTIDSMHLEDEGSTPNAFNLPDNTLKQREVIFIDIANDPIAASDYQERYDPTKFHSNKTKQGPLVGDWMPSQKPIMTCYKCVSIEFKWFGFQNKIENFMQRSSRRVLTLFNRQLFCTIDDWINLTMEDIRKIEERTKEELDRERNFGQFKGTSNFN